tara:strand:- start:3858 stop:5708 length:1851 start_codon:yes stop_codon:yes gene_type:complete
MSESTQGNDATQGQTYSKDYWDLVFEQLAKRKLFKMGVAVLVLMYGSTIFSPFIANDRPFVFEGINKKAYNSALSSMSGIATRLGLRMTQTDEQYLAELEASEMVGNEDAPQDRVASFNEFYAGLEERVVTLRSNLGDTPQEEGALSPTAILDAFVVQLQDTKAVFETSDPEAAKAQSTAFKKSARQLKKDLRPFDEAKPERGGIQLVATKSYPLWDDLSGSRIFFMVLWILAAAWPIWNKLVNRVVMAGDRERIRKARWPKVFVVLGVSAVCWVAWASVFGAGGDMNDNAPYKSGLTAGTFVAQRAGTISGDEGVEYEPVWAFARYGLAQTNQAEMFRPPTWWRHSDMNDEGDFVSGPRATTAAESTGEFQKQTQPVDVLVGEPELNAWNRHLMGVDKSGRDFFTRLLWGGKTSLVVGLLSAFLLTLIGVVIGSIAGYFGGWVDTGIMRLIEILQSIPAFFLILLTMAFIPAETMPPIFAIVIVIALIRWTGVARLVRGEFLRLREQDFVVAAQALGFSNARTIFRHVLPNAMSPVLVSAAFSIAAGILTESAVSFLGFGIAEPDASWGSLVNESKNPSYWWIQLFPGILIFVTVTCYNLVGDAIRDAMDPKLKL